MILGSLHHVLHPTYSQSSLRRLFFKVNLQTSHPPFVLLAEQSVRIMPIYQDIVLLLSLNHR